MGKKNLAYTIKWRIENIIKILIIFFWILIFLLFLHSGVSIVVAFSQLHFSHFILHGSHQIWAHTIYFSYVHSVHNIKTLQHFIYWNNNEATNFKGNRFVIVNKLHINDLFQQFSVDIVCVLLRRVWVLSKSYCIHSKEFVVLNVNGMI